MKPEYIGNYTESIFNKLLKDLDWISTGAPRDEYFMSDNALEYTYGTGRGERTYSSSLFHPLVKELMEKGGNVVNRVLGMKILTFVLTLIMIAGMLVPQTTIAYAEDGIKFHYKDDFNDFNSNFWTVVDKNGPVLEAMDISEGIITLTATKTDNYPTLISKGIPFVEW